MHVVVLLCVAPLALRVEIIDACFFSCTEEAKPPKFNTYSYLKR